MVGNTDTNTNINISDNNVLHTTPHWTCKTCSLAFESQSEQRQHMKETWHVHNLKRRIADLPVLTRNLVETDNAGLHHTEHVSEIDCAVTQHEVDAVDDNKHGNRLPSECLFCPDAFEESTNGLMLNIEHMTNKHDLFIPNQSSLIDLGSFLSYLVIVVKDWNECLSCGVTTSSTSAIQSHMKDNNHCQLNFEREPELYEFWEAPERPPGAASLLKGGVISADMESEIWLSSGRLIGSRLADPSAFRPRKRQSTAIAAMQEPSDSQDRSPPDGLPVPGPQILSNRELTRRDEQGVLGISVQQRGALVVAQKKAQRSEAVAQRATEWINNRSSNTQKFDQIDTTKVGKRGRQTHKLLPR